MLRRAPEGFGQPYPRERASLLPWPPP